MSIPLFQVDSFTSEPFRGNPAGVCLLEREAAEEWMRRVAQEMSLSETAFVWALEEGGFGLRWFTPACEVDLCGHATLAAGHLLIERGLASGEEVVSFSTKSGRLTVRRDGEWLEMDLPSRPVAYGEPPAGLSEALGVDVHPVGRNGLGYEFVEVADERTLRSIRPDFVRLSRIEAVGVVPTARGNGRSEDFLCRFFGPRVGVNEDPVTGSAFCALGPYWSSRLGKETLLAHQASARGGDVRVRLEGDRVVLGGQAVTTLHATITDIASRGAHA